ncbi:MAG: hypothetical protein ACE5QV_06660, partial [Fidelibacterota bacterium]
MARAYRWPERNFKMSINRRQFIKISLTGGMALAAQYELASMVKARELIKGGKSVSRTTGTSRHSIPSTCGMCRSHCGIIGFLEDNILVKIEGNPEDPNSRGKICGRGQSGIQYLYNPDRILYPMKRV